VWQWVRHGAALAEGPRVSRDLVQETIQEELARLRQQIGDQAWAGRRFEEASELFEQVALSEEFVDFLTLPAYERID